MPLIFRQSACTFVARRTRSCLYYAAINRGEACRATRQGCQPDKWDGSICGHIQPGESVAAAARREAVAELGLSDLALEFLYTYFVWRTDRESELIMTYRVRSDGPFTPNFEHEWQMYCNYFSAADGVEMSA